MRSLPDLLASAEGVALLDERGVLTNASAFAEGLRPPARPDLADLLGISPDRHLVYVGQQVCADLAASTAAKFSAAGALAGEFGVAPAILWHDMDSTRSERFGARIVLPTTKRLHGIWLVPRQSADVEPRFVPVDRAALETAFTELSTWAENAHRGDGQTAHTRISRLAAATLAEDVTTLADATRALASTLLREELGFEAPSATASQMVAAGLLVDAVEEYLANLDDVVRVFNDAVDDLLARGIDAQVRPLPPDYLPLRFSCPEDDVRLRLTRVRRGRDLFATATCRCGQGYTFHLGAGRPALGELAATGRWSIDVSMPVHHNDLASGWVAGRSTALYGLVFNEVLTQVLGRKPIPGFVPPELGDAAAYEEGAETLLVRHLRGSGDAR